MAAVNLVILLGNLGADPEVRYMPNGEATCSFRMATTEKWKDKSGEQKERTEWHRVVLFGRTAEVAGEYLKKGRSVYIEGRNQTREYEKDGVKQYIHEVVATRMQMIGDGGDRRDGAPARSQSGGDYRAARDGSKAPAAGGTTRKSGADFDDDIPF
jgi:single-strand DNA-binding protein